ncbi:MAG: cation:proton antiporter [Bdellovibrionales bacterium]|nr:cation:proton antiporter [Bdellovibrionales bacterium]
MKEILFQIVLVFVLGAACQWASWRFRIPTILTLLVSGLLVGPIFGILDPDYIFGHLLFPIVSLAVAVILYEGGLDLQIKELKGKTTTIFSLVTVGCIVNWILISFAAIKILGLNLHFALLVGAVLTVSGPTVVQPLLRFIRPKEPAYSILKWEGILIDPIGAVLAVLMLEEVILIANGEDTSLIIFGLCGTLGSGGLIGLAVGKFFIRLTKTWGLPEELYNTISLACLFLAFYTSNFFYEEAGLVAVTVMGIVVGNESHPAVRHIISFKENLRVLLISSLFIILAARVDLNSILAVSAMEVFFILFVVLIARPVSVIFATLFQNIPWPSRLFLAWMFPRGIVAAAVSSLFAIRLQEQGIPEGDTLVAIVFLIILSTVVIYGMTGPLVARLLDVAQLRPSKLLLVGVNTFTIELARLLQREQVPFVIVDTNVSKVHQSKLEGFPAIHGNLMSTEVLDEIDVGGIYYSIVLTTNHEANALIALRLEELLGHGKSLQTPPANIKLTRGDIDVDYRGNFFPNPETPLERLASLLASGAGLKAVNMSAEFSIDHLREKYSDLIPLFRLRDHRIRPYNESSAPEITAGDKIVFIGKDIASKNG